MKELNNKDEIIKLIKENPISVVYFSGVKCGACEVIKVKVESILRNFANIVSCEVNGEKHIDIAADFDIFSLPILLLYVDGRETIRVGRNVDLMDLERNIERYYNLIFD